MDCREADACEQNGRRSASSNTLSAAILTALAHAIALVLLIAFSLA